MSNTFPAQPQNGQTATLDGTLYYYNSNTNAWYLFTGGAFPTMYGKNQDGALFLNNNGSFYQYQQSTGNWLLVPKCTISTAPADQTTATFNGVTYIYNNVVGDINAQYPVAFVWYVYTAGGNSLNNPNAPGNSTGSRQYNFANILINNSAGYSSTNYLWWQNFSGEWTKIVQVYQCQSDGTWANIWPTTGVVNLTTNANVIVPPGISYVDILLVGGGGGGGQGIQNGHNGAGGGGGGGGVVEEFGLPVQAGQVYQITIGQGGAGADSNSGNAGQSGGNTTIYGPVNGGTPVTYIAYGGAGGSGFYQGNIATQASGGGGYSTRDSPGVAPPGLGGPQGYAGGYGATNNSVDAGGGGGGAGGDGGQAQVGHGGNGGPGYTTYMTGVALTYGGGGGGGVTNGGTGGSGGSGGGGAGGQNATISSSQGYGGGGGGGGAGSDSSVGPNAGNGAQGCVIVNFYSAQDFPVAVEIDSGTGSPVIPTGAEISYGGGGGGGFCFSADTEILMADNTTKKIKDVQIGDQVWNYNKTVVNQVTMIEFAADTDFGFLYSPDNTNKPFATANHPLYINDQLSSLDPGKCLEWYPWLGQTNRIDTIAIAEPTGNTVYNLWVSGDSTYTVNGYGTTSIIGDGGLLRMIVERNIIAVDRASELVVKFANSGPDISQGGYTLNNLFGNWDIEIVNQALIYAFKDDSHRFAQKVVLGIFQLTGKIINLFR